MRYAALGLCLGLAACAQTAGGIGDPGAGQPTAVAKLGVISRADIERELQPGAGCALHTDAGQVLVAVIGDAIARPANALVHLKHDGTSFNQLFEGGRFSKEDFSIAIMPTESHATNTGEEETTRRVSVTVSDGGTSEQLSGRWVCGS